MRIGLIIYGSLATLSGGYLYDRMLVRQLETNGHAVQLFSLPWHGYARHLGDNLSTGWRRALASATVDLMLQDELNHPSLAWINPWLRGKVDYPLVSIVHHLRCREEHPAILLPLYRWVERRYLNSLDAYLTNSQTTKTSVISLLDRALPSRVAFPAADHLSTREPAVHDKEIAARAGEHGPLRILFVGNVIQRKALHSVLAALGEVNRSAWRLSVVGRLDVDPRYVEQTQQLAARLNFASQIEFLGRLSDAALIDQYRRHHMLAVPSYEGFGIVYLEAMRFGLPVIAATAGAACEIVTSGVDGYLVNPGDTKALAGAINTLATDRVQLKTMSLAARARYERHPTWAASMQGAVTWLESMQR